MKKILLFAAVLCIYACGGPNSRSAQDEIKELRTEAAQKDSIILDVFRSLNQISENLSAIKERENIITTSTADTEISKETRAQINEDIAAIGDLLEDNRQTIERLKGSTDNLRKANIRIQELDKLITSLNKQIADKNADIEALMTDLAAANIQIDELSTALAALSSEVLILSQDNEDLAVTVEEKDIALNAAYYIVGEEKELVKSGIVTKSGFIGRTLKVTTDYDLEKFTQISKNAINSIFVGKKRATIVTTHPNDSYELIMSDDKTLESIQIKDAVRFWESSRILVVSYK